jgi:hypothetical protein
VRGLGLLIVGLGGLIASVVVYLATGGAFVFFFLPLVLGLLLLGGRRRQGPIPPAGTRNARPGAVDPRLR